MLKEVVNVQTFRNRSNHYGNSFRAFRGQPNIYPVPEMPYITASSKASQLVCVTIINNFDPSLR